MFLVLKKVDGIFRIGKEVQGVVVQEQQRAGPLIRRYINGFSFDIYPGGYFHMFAAVTGFEIRFEG